MENRLLKFEILMQGIGILLGWNVILSSFDWFNSEFPDDNPSFIFPILNNGLSVIINPFIVLYGYSWSYSKRIIYSYAFVGSVLVLAPILVSVLDSTSGFAVTCILILIMGSASCVAQTTVFSMAGTLPDEYTNYVMIGNGVAGVFVNILRLICLGIFPQNSSGYLLSTTIYFIIAGAVIFCCAICQWHLYKHPLLVIALAKTDQKINLIKTDEELLIVAKNEGTKDLKPNLSNVKRNTKEVLLKIWQPLSCVFIGYFITFGMLSSVALSTEIPHLGYPYFSTLMVLTFNVFDFLGRSTPRIYILSLKTLWVLTLFRFITWFTFILIASDDPSVPPDWLFSYAWFKFLNMAFFAYTNGFASTCAMILGPSRVEDYEKAKAGSWMAMGLIYGIVAGSVIAFAFTNVGHIPS